MRYRVRCHPRTEPSSRDHADSNHLPSLPIGRRDRQVRQRACEILLIIGTKKSIPALKKVVAEKDFFLTRKVTEAIQAIEARQKAVD